jgi:hypothetical protein
MQNRILLTVCSLAAITCAFAQQLTPERAQKLGQAYGALMGYTWAMKYVSETCGGDARDLAAVWKQRNAVPLAQGEAMLLKMFAQMTAQFGQKQEAQVEARMRQQLDQLGQSTATGWVGKLKSLPPDQKAFVCKKWAADVRNGNWDIEKQSPALEEFLASAAH